MTLGRRGPQGQVHRDRLGRAARAIAETGVRAGIEFDKSSGGPIRVHTMTAR